MTTPLGTRHFPSQWSIARGNRARTSRRNARNTAHTSRGRKINHGRRVGMADPFATYTATAGPKEPTTWHYVTVRLEQFHFFYSVVQALEVIGTPEEEQSASVRLRVPGDSTRDALGRLMMRARTVITQAGQPYLFQAIDQCLDAAKQQE